MSWEPHITVAVVVAMPDELAVESMTTPPRRFLLVEERADSLGGGAGQLVYNQPAGHVEKGETLEQAAVREALEETGWDVKLTGFLGLYVYTPPFNRDITYYRACFLAEAITHNPEHVLDDGILHAVWMTREELASSDRLRSPLVLKCVDDAIAGQCYPLALVHEHHGSCGS
jgi:8-oxo-dGTP pyrophosphatase MutT (NUDIX family)